MSARSGLRMTQAQVNAYNAKHGFVPVDAQDRIIEPNLTQVFERERKEDAKYMHRSKRRGMTQAEREYELILKADWPDSQVLFEAYTLRLAHDCRYTPDFAVVHGVTLLIDFYEVKGKHVFEKALVKPRVAAGKFQHHRFYLARKTDHGWAVAQLRA